MFPCILVKASSTQDRHLNEFDLRYPGANVTPDHIDRALDGFFGGASNDHGGGAAWNEADNGPLCRNLLADMPMYIAASTLERPRRGIGRMAERAVERVMLLSPDGHALRGAADHIAQGQKD